MRVLDLFSGIGGFSLGLERAGMKTVAFCEIEPFPRALLAKHWPEVPCYDDVRTLTADQLVRDGVGPIDVICGGFPCQDVSAAGKRLGVIGGTRSSLYLEVLRLARDIRPRFIILENVAGLLSGPSEQPGGWFGRVLGDLAASGYDAEWQDVSAEDIGAPHPRARVWIVAYPSGSRLERLWCTERIEAEIANTRRANDASNAAFIKGIHRLGKRGIRSIIDGNAFRPEWAGQQWPETEPLLCRMDDGVPDRVGRTSACGNAVVPQIPEMIGRAIMEAERNAQ